MLRSRTDKKWNTVDVHIRPVFPVTYVLNYRAIYKIFICEGVKNIEGVINDVWQLPTTRWEQVMGNILFYIIINFNIIAITHVTVARVLNLSPLNYPFVDTINRGTVADL